MTEKQYRLFPNYTCVYISKFTKATRDAINLGFASQDVMDYLDGSQIQPLTCVIDYPLSQECKFHITKKGEYFYLSDIILAVCDKYREIYAEEDITSTIKAENIPGWWNRNETDGKWGISLHYLDELILTDIVLDTDTNTLILDISTQPSPTHMTPIDEMVQIREAMKKANSGK